MTIKRLAIISAICLYGFSNIGPQGFKAFLNPYFVETGTFSWDGIIRALEDGFENILSIESVNELYTPVKEKFINNKNVKITHGSSSIDLWDMIKDINEPITFWLDAHVFPPRTDGGKNCPLIEELDQIKRHPIKTHTILIDDMHCAAPDGIAGGEAFDFLTKEDLINKLLEINPNYNIYYVPGGNDGEYPENVMVAEAK